MEPPQRGTACTVLRRRGKRDSGGLPIGRPAQPYGSQIEVTRRPAAGCGPATATGEGRPGYGQRLPSCEGRQSLPAVWRSGGSPVNPGRFSGASCRSAALHALLQTRPSGSRAEGGSCAAQGLGGCASREDALSPRSGVHIEEPVRGPMRVSAVPGVPRREVTSRRVHLAV